MIRSVSSPSPNPRRRGPFFQVELSHWLDPVLADDAPPNRRAAWAELIRKAAWADDGPVRRGQLRTSVAALASEWRWSYGRVQRFLAALQKSRWIDVETDGLGAGSRSLITVRHLQQRLSRPGAPDELSDDFADDLPAKPTLAAPKSSAPAAGAPDELPDDFADERKETRPGLDGGRGKPRVAAPNERKPGEIAPELLAYAEPLVDALNWAQRGNGRIDQAAYRPVRVDHVKTLAAVQSLLAAGVNFEFARRYVVREASRYRPRDHESQIYSLAYLRGGLLKEWRQRHQLPLPPPITARDTGPIARVPAPPSPALGPEMRERARAGGRPVRVDGPLGAVIERLQQPPSPDGA